MFSTDEAKALVAAVRMARPRLDGALAAAAEGALSKILAVLPSAARAAAESLAIYAPSWNGHDPERERLERLRGAIEVRRKLAIAYRDEGGNPTRRTIRPLGCFYWGAVWTLGAWCEARNDFRNFRVDRIVELQVLEEMFRDEPGKTLPDLMRSVERD
jgi:predicted DNA-binding transcriptional regulator YafY